MTCKVISVLFCNLTTSTADSQEEEAAQEITLMNYWNEKLFLKTALQLILFVTLE